LAGRTGIRVAVQFNLRMKSPKLQTSAPDVAMECPSSAFSWRHLSLEDAVTATQEQSNHSYANCRLLLRTLQEELDSSPGQTDSHSSEASTDSIPHSRTDKHTLKSLQSQPPLEPRHLNEDCCTSMIVICCPFCRAKRVYAKKPHASLPPNPNPSPNPSPNPKSKSNLAVCHILLVLSVVLIFMMMTFLSVYLLNGGAQLKQRGEEHGQGSRSGLNNYLNSPLWGLCIRQLKYGTALTDINSMQQLPIDYHPSLAPKLYPH
jgi:hypothetical protein